MICFVVVAASAAAAVVVVVMHETLFRSLYAVLGIVQAAASIDYVMRENVRSLSPWKSEVRTIIEC